MNPSLYTFVSTDLPALLALTFACMACALLGNFLVLRRESLMGDAISHAVLPGLVVAFILTSSRGAFPMLAGAGVSGLVTVLLIDTVRKRTPVEPGAAMGVVFSVMFALGVVLLRLAAAENVDLDADCVLYGQAETITWFPPRAWPDFLSLSTLSQLPRQTVTLAIGLIVCALLVTLFFKELTIASFDPGLAASLGLAPGWVTRALMASVAAVAVIAFEAVGSILVIAMLICPAATARLLTDRLKTQVWLSLLLGVLIGVGGYVSGALLPLWLGFERSVIVSGAASVVAGLVLALAIVAAPRHGLIARARRKAHVASEIAADDVLGLLYRAEELGRPALTSGDLASGLQSPRAASRGLGIARKRGDVTADAAGIRLSESGRKAAQAVVRSHRLWELFLVQELGLRADHVHPTAERLEHLKVRQERLVPRVADARDPHDRPIPPA